eukprot:949761-Karenia_brevis.AAC.1
MECRPPKGTIHHGERAMAKREWFNYGCFNVNDSGIVYVSPACPGLMERRLPKGTIHHGEHALT